MLVREKVEENNMLKRYNDGGVVLAKIVGKQEIREGNFDTAFWNGAMGSHIICISKVSLDDEIDENDRIIMMTEEAFDKMCATTVLKNQAIDLANKKYEV